MKLFFFVIWNPYKIIIKSEEMSCIWFLIKIKSVFNLLVGFICRKEISTCLLRTVIVYDKDMCKSQIQRQQKRFLRNECTQN